MGTDKNYAENCIHCGQCKRKCVFLRKHGLDLKDFAGRPDLAYSCFLCGRCTEVCPEKINGKEIALAMRRELVQNGEGAKIDPAYSWLLWEKNGYRFANYRKSKKKSVFMPGCNFSSFYPKTTKRLESILRNYDIGILYECCGKPVYELGMSSEANRSLQSLEKRLLENGVGELILLCPNCYHFMKGRIRIPVVSIYDKLKELGEGNPVERAYFPIYYPCPDRMDKTIFTSLKYFLKGEITEPFQNVQCCGLGGCAGTKEPELSGKMPEMVAESGEKELYTYCASCISSFRRNGFEQAYHLLPLIVGVDEKVPLGIQPFLNRAKHKVF